MFSAVKKLFTDVMDFFKNLFSQAPAMVVVSEDAIKIVGMIATKDYVGAIAYMVQNVQDINSLDINAFIQQAQNIGLDLTAFQPLVSAVTSFVSGLNLSQKTTDVQAKIAQVTAFVQNLVSQI